MRVLSCLLVLIALATTACRDNGNAPATPTDADAFGWEKIYDKAIFRVDALEMLDNQYGLAVIGGTIERTTDGSATWHEVDPDIAATGPVAIADRQHAWVGGDGGLLRTTDGGNTWERLAAPPAGITTLQALSAEELWATGGSIPFGMGSPPHGASELVHSTDAGANWERVDVPGYGIFLGVSFVGDEGWVIATECHPGDLYGEPEFAVIGRYPAPLCLDEPRLVRTRDAGHTWDRIDGLPGDVQAIQRVSRGEAFASVRCQPRVCDADLYSTSDGGRTWQSRPHDAPNRGIQGLRFISPDVGWLGTSVCDPMSRSSCDDTPRVVHTIDGGRSWQFLDAGGALLAGTLDGRAITTGGSGGISVYDPATGETSAAVTDAGPSLSGISFATNDDGAATAGYGSERWVTHDGGASWSREGDVWPIIFRSGSTWWRTGEPRDKRLFRSRDAGVTWEPMPSPSDADRTQAVIVAAAGDRVWVSVGSWLWRWDDDVARWHAANFGIGVTYHAFDRDHGVTTVCAETPCAHSVRVTADGGDTWTEQPIPDDVGSIEFTTVSDWWAQSDAGCQCLRVTHDAGVTWQRVSTAPWAVGRFVALDGLRASAFSFGLSPPSALPTIIHTKDGGKTWQEELTLEVQRAVGVAAAEDTFWVTYSSPLLCLPDGECSGPPGRVVIYRRDPE